MEPEPHYCTVRPRPDGVPDGCPAWPMCVLARHGEPRPVTPDPMLRGMVETLSIAAIVVLVLALLWAVLS